MIAWVVTLDTGRFGDWVIVQARTEEEVMRKLTRAQRRRVASIKPSRSTREWLELEGRA